MVTDLHDSGREKPQRHGFQQFDEPPENASLPCSTFFNSAFLALLLAQNDLFHSIGIDIDVIAEVFLNTTTNALYPTFLPLLK